MHGNDHVPLQMHALSSLNLKLAAAAAAGAPLHACTSSVYICMEYHPQACALPTDLSSVFDRLRRTKELARV